MKVPKARRRARAGPPAQPGKRRGVLLVLAAIGAWSILFGDDPAADAAPPAPAPQPQPAAVAGRALHAHTWRDYSRRSYASVFSIADEDRDRAHAYRNLLSVATASVPQRELHQSFARLDERSEFTWYWLWVYANLVRHDQRVEDLHRGFDVVAQRHRPDRRLFAEIIVAAIQHIPYQLVHAGTCVEVVANPDTDRYTVDYHRDDFANDLARGRPCLPGQRFGLQSPVEFLHNLIGDCDTRVVLLFTILDHYGYDVAILASQSYLHCVLGIDLPAAGHKKRHRGRAYALWETTAPNYEPGQINPNWGDLGQWVVILTS